VDASTGTVVGDLISLPGPGVFTTVDVQASWATPWNGQITVGARNIFDQDPPTSEGFYTNYQHDVFGRVPYVRWEQDL
jgi:outer membrane receptor protein involved in Fe transport